MDPIGTKLLLACALYQFAAWLVLLLHILGHIDLEYDSLLLRYSPFYFFANLVGAITAAFILGYALHIAATHWSFPETSEPAKEDPETNRQQ